MYGLVNQAIRDLVLKSAGEDAWQDISQAASHDGGSFQPLKSYPDQLTYALVGASSEHLKTPAPDLLRAFGSHWVTYTGLNGHRAIFSAYPKGKEGLIKFIEDLDAMHASIMMAMPELRPPEISCQRVGDHALRVFYYSQRQGLAPMVIGLLEGLLTYFEVSGTVIQENTVIQESGPLPEISTQTTPAATTSEETRTREGGTADERFFVQFT